MRLLDRILGRSKPDLSQTDRYRMVSAEKGPNLEQEKASRDEMERQMEASREKRESDAH